jgi:hypothetical protein
MDRKQLYSIIMLSILLISSIAVAFFSAPIQQNQDLSNLFPKHNEFNETVDFTTQSLAINPQNPRNFPGVEIERLYGGVWIEYSCKNCSEQLAELKKIVEKYYPRVYISPGTGNYSLYLRSAFSSKPLDNFNLSEAEKFICSNLYNPPDVCILVP